MDKNAHPVVHPPHKKIMCGIHFIGIGGIGISALAQWFFTLSNVEGLTHSADPTPFFTKTKGLAQKWVISGSDISPNEITRSLQKLGIKVKFGHKKGNIPERCVLVIYTQAIRPENQELKEARRRKLTILSYPEAIGKLSESYKTIAIAGAHGKSTITAIVSMILLKAGFDPTVIIGTKLKEFLSINSRSSETKAGARLASNEAAGQVTSLKYGSNFRFGKSKYFVLEADEYGGAFLHYSPLYTIVTNIDEEHLDFYKNLKNIKQSFLEFLSRTKNGGALILNRDNKILFSLKSAIERIAKSKNLKVVWYSLKNPEVGKIKKVIQISGKHNVSNALGAFHLSKILKIPEKTVLQAIHDYRGSWRRMEYRGDLRIAYSKEHIAKNRIHKPYAISHMPVFDDYAHHPTEIKATLQAFHEKFSNKKIICVFQPHQVERLKLLFKDFQSAFTDADITLILPIYQVAGRDPSTSSGQVLQKKFNSETLVKAIQKKYPKKLIFYLSNPDNLKKALNALFSNPLPHKSAPALSRVEGFSLRKSAILVMMGAGDIVKYTDSLIKN